MCFKTQSSLIFKWDCGVSNVCKSSALGMKTPGINLTLWRERQGSASESGLRWLPSGTCLQPVTMLNGSQRSTVSASVFTTAPSLCRSPGMGTCGCVYKDAGVISRELAALRDCKCVILVDHLGRLLFLFWECNKNMYFRHRRAGDDPLNLLISCSRSCKT